MRIDLYGPAAVSTSETVAAAQKSQSTLASQQTVQPGPEPAPDRTTLSAHSLSVAALASLALAAGAERARRVSDLEQSVSGGDYLIQPDVIAQAILRDRA